MPASTCVPQAAVNTAVAFLSFLFFHARSPRGSVKTHLLSERWVWPHMASRSLPRPTPRPVQDCQQSCAFSLQPGAAWSRRAPGRLLAEADEIWVPVGLTGGLVAGPWAGAEVTATPNGVFSLIPGYPTISILEACLP